MYIFYYPVLLISLALPSFACLLACLLGALSFSPPFVCRSFHPAGWLICSFDSFRRGYLHRPLYVKAQHSSPRTSHHPSCLPTSTILARSPHDVLVTLVSVLSYAPKLKMPGIPSQHGHPQYVTTTSTTPSSLHSTIIIIPKTNASRQKVLHLLFHHQYVVFHTYFCSLFWFDFAGSDGKRVI